MRNEKTPVGAGVLPEGTHTPTAYQPGTPLSTGPGAPDRSEAERETGPERNRTRKGPAHLGYVRISVATPPSNPHHFVTICPHGTVVKEGGRVITKKPQTGGKRGVVKEWSKQSRTRLRYLLATSDGPEGWKPIGMTGTVPGNVIDEAAWRRLWWTFRRRIPSIPIVWRVELQQRKQPHMHMVAWIPEGVEGGKAKADLMLAWWKAVRSLGQTEWADKDDLTYTGTRMAMPGAYEHAAAFDELEQADDFGWWRYLASHTGKAKQAQLGWKGRAWGVLNPERLRKTQGQEHGLTEKQWFAMRRWLRRLTTYRGAGSGRKSIWYVRPDTMRQMVELARTGPFDGPGYGAALEAP